MADTELMNNAPHTIRSTFNHLDMVGIVYGEFFRVGSASGPLATQFTDEGTTKVGDKLTLAYNFDTDSYALRTGGWKCTVKRINKRTITVQSDTTNAMHRVEWN